MRRRLVPPDPRVQRTRPLASLGGSPLTRHPLGSRGVVVLTALVLAASSCESASPSLLVTVTTPRGETAPFHAGSLALHLFERSDGGCGNCWSSGSIELLRGETLVRTVASGPAFSAVGHASREGVDYCTNGLAFEVDEPGRYRVRLVCGDGRQITSEEFTVER